VYPPLQDRLGVYPPLQDRLGVYPPLQDRLGVYPPRMLDGLRLGEHIVDLDV